MTKPIGYYYDNSGVGGPLQIGFHRVVSKLGDRVAVGIVATDGKESVRIISASQIVQQRQAVLPSQGGVLRAPVNDEDGSPQPGEAQGSEG